MMALPRLETIGFRAAVHKPMGDVKDVTSISFIQSVQPNGVLVQRCRLFISELLEDVSDVKCKV